MTTGIGKKLTCMAIALVLSISALVFYFQNTGSAATAEGDIEKNASEPAKYDSLVDFGSFGLSDEQLSALDLMNHLTIVMYEINDSQINRMYLENTFTSIINYLNVSKVDLHTKQQINNILDTIEEYVMVDVKRERLQYILERGQAAAIRKAVPNPLSIMSFVHSGSAFKSLASIAYMVTDSITSYQDAASEAEQAFIQNNWELDDVAKKAFFNVRQEWFNYKRDMQQTYSLPPELILDEMHVQSFINYKNSELKTTKRMNLEKHRGDYQLLSEYWLEMAKSYYDAEMYAECLSAVNTYQALSTQIYTLNPDFANVLPMAITSSANTQTEEEYIQNVPEYCRLIMSNTHDDDWSLRYFAAVTYLDLYSKTNNQEYLDQAYNIVHNNVTYLKDQQLKLNEEYLKPFEPTKVPQGSTKAREEEIKKYNELRQNERKTELPPVYDAFLVNLNLLFGMKDVVGMSESESVDIDEMLHESTTPLFIDKALSDRFWITEGNVPAPEKYTIKMEKGIFKATALLMPATCLSKGSTVKVIIHDGDTERVANDWIVTNVDRKNSTNPADFVVKLESKIASEWYNSSTPTADVMISYTIEDGPIELFHAHLNGQRHISIGEQSVFFEGTN